MKKKLFLTAITAVLAIVPLLSSVIKRDTPQGEIIIPLQKGEKVWAGVVMEGHMMPLNDGYTMNFHDGNKRNQIQPIILTSFGQLVWSEEAYQLDVRGNSIIISKNKAQVIIEKPGTTLKEAERFAAKKFYPASGLLPDELLFKAPQYNTWIELNYNQNQADVLRYARSILDNGFPAGVIMIDDTWQEDYGVWDFHARRFPDPKAMVDTLHQMGFKVMLWVCPMISADQTRIYTELKNSKALMMERESPDDTYATAKEPIMIRWWDGVSAELDFSSPVAVKWFDAQLDRLVSDYGVDGFKFDAADAYFYPENSLSYGNVTPNDQAELYANFGLRFPLNEYRACWKMGGQPLVQRLHDKEHSWVDLQTLIPNMLIEGLVGYPFSCPDMIGGGMLGTFHEDGKMNKNLMVRSAQCHALMPMMQFSVAPWRVLDEASLRATKQAVECRQRFMPLIMQLANNAAKTGEPIMRSMEYVFPHQGLSAVIDQFMLGDNLLVAPMLDEKKGRNVMLPKGKWKADDSTVYNGGRTIYIEVSLDRLPYFERLK